MQEIMLLLELIRNSLQQTGEFVYEEKYDGKKLEQLIKCQQLECLVWPLISVQEDETWKIIAQHLEDDYNGAVHKSLVQQMEMQDLLDRMEKEKIDCLPLKGYIMKDYYFEPTFRSMTDFDVLLKNFNRKKIRVWMEKLGYELDDQEDEHHDVYIKKPYSVAEIHESLSDEKVEKEIPQIDEWLEDIWKKCILEDGKQHTYQMKEEDFYIFHLIHMYKHIRHSGMGIRPLIDIQVFMEKAEARLDWDYINSVLKELKLTRFEHVMRTLSRKCFSDKEIILDEDDKMILKFFLGSGLFGDSKSEKTIQVVTASNKSYSKRRILTAFRIIFQPARVLEERYPILKRFPIALPAIWVIRVFRVVFKEKQKIVMLKEASTKEEYDKMKKLFEVTGIVE